MKAYIKKIKHIIEAVIYGSYYKFMHTFFNKNSYKVSWDSKYNNFGDIVTPYILSNITDEKIEQINKSQFYPYEHYLVIGSILDRSTENTIIWGSGFISEDSILLGKPKKIYAVRGPKTREKLLNMGIDCPEVYGDPALLLPQIYYPEVEKKYKLGIIPHYIDKNTPWLNNIAKDYDVKIIDIQVDDPLIFIREILSCEKIASSSLHGVITADAYSIPSVWIEFSNNVKGNGFKFFDYFLSVGRKEEGPLIIKEKITILDVLNNFSNYKIKINLEKLLKACPFTDKDRVK